MFVAEEEVHVLRTSVRGLEMPVVRVPSCARGPPCVFVYCTCTTNLYYCTAL